MTNIEEITKRYKSSLTTLSTMVQKGEYDGELLIDCIEDLEYLMYELKELRLRLNDD